MSKGLQERILQELKAMDGKVGFYYKNLVTGETFGYHEDEQFLPASIVKLPLLAAMLMMRERGETDFGEMITIRKDQKLPGCGVVQHMTGDQNGDVTLDINSLYKFMIVISDTTATNALYRHYGNDRVIAAFQELGLVGTQFNRAYYDEERESRRSPISFGTKKCTEGHWSVRRRQKNWSASYCSNRSITRWAVSCRWAFRSRIRQERKRTKRMMWGSFTEKNRLSPATRLTKVICRLLKILSAEQHMIWQLKSIRRSRRGRAFTDIIRPYPIS